jgi:energy-coupling factor transporter ATP-binding protein EcfA2
MRMKILVLGYTGSGKTTAAEILAAILDTSYCNTSDKLIDDFAISIGLPSNVIANNKDKYRNQLLEFGRAKQKIDPLWPQAQQLEHSDILTGLRNKNEIEAAKKHKLYDLIIWVSRPGYTIGSTDKLSPSDADVVINNDGDITALKEKLLRLLTEVLPKSAI